MIVLLIVDLGLAAAGGVLLGKGLAKDESKPAPPPAEKKTQAEPAPTSPTPASPAPASSAPARTVESRAPAEPSTSVETKPVETKPVVKKQAAAREPAKRDKATATKSSATKTATTDPAQNFYKHVDDDDATTKPETATPVQHVPAQPLDPYK